MVRKTPKQDLVAVSEETRGDVSARVFRNGSKTYFNSSRFFPEPVRSEVSILYAFVRKADDYVDAIPQEVEAFHAFEDRYRRAANGEITGDTVVDQFAELARRKGIEPAWIEAFLESMRMDLDKAAYESVEEIDNYIYGSAGVVGLMMAQILGLDRRAQPYAERLGAAMQYVNFIRDVAEDQELGRTYLPTGEMKQLGLSSLAEEEVRRRTGPFLRFMRAQVDRYLIWQAEAEQGFSFIPPRYRVAIMTASAMYKWTARRIRRNPFVVYRKKVKPSLVRIALLGLYSWLLCRLPPWGATPFSPSPEHERETRGLHPGG